MKNEKMAQAMSYIDYALIEEANETVAPKSKVLSGGFLKSISRYGSIAACFILVLGIALIIRLGGNEVLLYGESIIEPEVITEVSLPLELEFKRETVLTLDIGEMIILDKNGDTVFSGSTYTVNGKVSICLAFPSDVTDATIRTNRGYNIVLSKDAESEIWYVNIEKNN